MLIPIEEHALLIFWIQLLVLVALARFLGALMRRVGLPSVIGELGAGLILGPSVFGKLWPHGFEEFLPGDEAGSAALLAIAWVGVAMLLVVTGFETDLALITKLGRAAVLVTAFSLIVPFLGGLGVGYLLPEAFVGLGLEGEGGNRTTFALFVALALSVSSLAVIAKILSELGLMRRDFGQITVAAGMANDVVGWVLLAIFAGLASSGGFDVVALGKTLGGLALFTVLAFTVGQRIIDNSLRNFLRSSSDVTGALTVAILSMLMFGVVTQYLGVEAVLGAFVAGVVLNRSRFQNPEVLHHLESLTSVFFAPVFFATAGLRVDLGLLNNSEALLWAGIVLAVALIAKFVGAYTGAVAAGQSKRAGTALGAGLNARGALEIVIATVALGLGVFNDTAYTVIVLVPMVTTVVASVSLRFVVRDWLGSEDEQVRLEREETLARNLIVKADRILLPSMAGPASIAAAQILQFAWPPEAPVSIISVGSSAGSKDTNTKETTDITVLRNVLYEREIEHREVAGSSSDMTVASEIAAEAKLGYGSIVVGVAVDHEGGLLSPMVDELLQSSPVPVIIVRRARNLDRPLPGAYTRALVPVTGTASSKAAQEIAFSISEDLGTELLLSHVLPAQPGLPLKNLFSRGAEEPEDDSAANRLIEQARTAAEGHGATVQTSVVSSPTIADGIVRTAARQEADLVVLGAALRSVDGRPFLGQTVESVLERCDATVVVVTMPRNRSDDSH